MAGMAGRNPYPAYTPPPDQSGGGGMGMMQLGSGITQLPGQVQQIPLSQAWGSSKAGDATSPPPAAAPSYGGGGPGGPLNIQAQSNPALDALLGRSTANLDTLQNGGGQLMDQAAGRLRDIREGGRAALQQSEGIRGVGSSNRLAGYEADTSRGEQGAVADMVNNRQQNYTSAINSGLGVANAGAQQQLAEKQFGLASYNAQNQAAGDNFSRFMALLQAQRQSPIYSGTVTTGGMGGSFGY